ncbi:Glu S.griseus protease inhibitor [Morus notabilis]|uniref:Glu S.griseus protease inhibitor n=1 Tax=Morus notabilis TaxID=981085 RepID=W9RI77_9ROSA|nr:Glu S.griseus protease inhibitor [Morus notabilis]
MNLNMASNSQGKNSWPELVGMNSDVAEKKIKSENPSVTSVNIVPEGSFVTMEIRSDRARVWVNENGIVTRVPIIG